MTTATPGHAWHALQNCQPTHSAVAMPNPLASIPVIVHNSPGAANDDAPQPEAA